MAFRDYLKTVDPYAYEYTGNDARIDLGKVGQGGDTAQFSTTDSNKIQDYVTGLYQNYQKSLAPTSMSSIYGATGGGAPRPVYAPKLDIAAVNAKARSAAEGAVNPYYTKVLNDFLSEQATKRQQQQSLYDTNVKNYEDQLKNTLEQNAITQTRTGEDVATNIAQTNQTADQFQTDAGQAFDANRLDLARKASTGGLGAQQIEGATQGRNTQETRQIQKFQEAKDTQELFKTRTFDDLARSGKLAGEATEKGKAAAKFDLDTYIQNAGFAEQGKRNELEQSRLEAVGREQGNQAKLGFNQYLAGISNPAQYAAAVQTYGRAF